MLEDWQATVPINRRLNSVGTLLSVAHHWNAIERHPRLVFDEMGPVEDEMVLYYLKRSKPFTVVVGDA